MLSFLAYYQTLKQSNYQQAIFSVNRDWMKHFASQEDIVTMIYMYLQILQQYDIDLNLLCLRQMYSSPMEDHIFMFPCAISTDSPDKVHRLHLPPTHVNLFLQSICTRGPATPLHLGKDSLTLLSSSCTFSACTTSQMADLRAREPCPSAFFPPKSKQNPRKCVLPLSYSNTNKKSAPPTEPIQASPK